MTKKYIWKTEEFKNEHYSDYLKMDNFIKSLNLDKDTKFCLSSYSDYEIIEVNYWVEESDEEYQERLKKDKKIQKIIYDQEYQQYLLLKEKFEGKNK